MSIAAPEGKGIGSSLISLSLCAIFATGILLFYVFKPGAARAKKPIGVVISGIVRGDPYDRIAAINSLGNQSMTPVEFAELFPHFLNNMTDESEPVRIGTASAVGRLLWDARKVNQPDATFLRYCFRTHTALVGLLDETSPMLRSTAARSLGSVAIAGTLDAPPARLVACLDDPAEVVRIAASVGLMEYDQGPELVVPVVLRRLPSEGLEVRKAFNDLFWGVRLKPSVLLHLVEGLSSDDRDVCLASTVAINQMGREAGPALPAILTLIRKELKNPPQSDPRFERRVIEMALGAVGEIAPDTPPPPGTVELLSEVLKQALETQRILASERTDSPAASFLAEVLKQHNEVIQWKLAWSLGILGRNAAAAVPMLISTFEAASENRSIIAESLAAITRGTQDEDRVIKTLAKAWTTATPTQRTRFARALRSLGPKSERFVPDLKRVPIDTTPTEIRRFRFPRSRRGEILRESPK